MKKGVVDVITMGCSKNLVDSETLMHLFERSGYHCVHDAKRPQGEIVVVNTCGFIGDAKEESINMILELAEAKKTGRIGKLFVMGCLSERYREDLKRELPEADGFYGKFDYRQLVSDLTSTSNPSQENENSSESLIMHGCESVGRHLTTPLHFAYLKISEGCDRRCAYCAIPLITGHHVSRRKEEILDEVRGLVSLGVKEFQIIAQELTYYGMDLYGRREIANLIDQMAGIEGVEWIRLHYAYPNGFPWELTDVMRNHNNVCKYLDIALQHVSDHMLERMHRHVTKEETMDFVSRLRSAVPGICLRTTLMVGFPGETEEDFEELMEFVRWARFERMGAFAYSEEEGTYSAIHYEDDVPEHVKRERLDRLMALQQKISEEITAAQVGKVLRVIIDRKEGEYYIGRSEFSSPEVDPEVLIACEGKRLRKGCFYNVLIKGSDEFDLYGRLVVE